MVLISYRSRIYGIISTLSKLKLLTGKTFSIAIKIILI